MDELPELPFEKVLSYLTLEDLFKSRAVCRAWCNRIDRFRVKCLCYCEHPRDSLFPKSRLVGLEFAASFVRSSSFKSFFSTYSQSILSNLKKCRFCEMRIHISNTELFASTLQSFNQLKHLSIVSIWFLTDLKKEETYQYQDSRRSFKLNLPMLDSLYFERLYGLQNLTLNAPKLRSLTFKHCDLQLQLKLVHADSVEWLNTHYSYVKVKKLKNLKYLFFERTFEINPKKLLHSLRQLKEFHLIDRSAIWQLFEQRQQCGHADLKFYLWGCLVNGPDDPAMNVLIYDRIPIEYLADNPSRIADHISFSNFVRYEEIEHVSSEFAISFLNRCSDLTKLVMYTPVEDIERFLYVLKNSNQIVELEFLECPEGGQPQELFNRLSEHCAVQRLVIGYVPLNLEFLFSLKHLVVLEITGSPISAETVRKVWEELPFLFFSYFFYANKRVKIQVLNPYEIRKGLKIYVDKKDMLVVDDRNAAIQFVTNLQ